jgi:hypothetical protein
MALMLASVPDAAQRSRQGEKHVARHTEKDTLLKLFCIFQDLKTEKSTLREISLTRKIFQESS